MSRLKNLPNDIARYGGKAVSLAKLLQAGIRVPDGFVIVAGTDVSASKEEIIQAFDQLSYPLVAVRSSAVMEDGKQTAWAGQLHTSLNVTRDQLLDAVLECQASGASARAHAYAAQHGIEAGAVAVIVQGMVQSEVSGVAFSVHPVTQDSSVVVIEAGLGLGEAIVSGEITPDTYVVSKDGGSIERHVSKQDKQLILQNGKTEYVPTGDHADQQKLPDDLLLKLARTVAQLEVLYKQPVDVEWAFAAKQMYVTQCRPITTL